MTKKLIFSHLGAIFNGSNEYVLMSPNYYNFQHYGGGGGVSVWCWAKTTATTDQWLMGPWSSTGNDNGYGMSIKATTGLLVAQLTADEVTPYQIRVESDIAVNDGEWHLLAWTYDGSDGLSQASNVTMYVDGIPVPSTTINDTLQRLPASGTLTSTAIPNDGDTVTIGTPSLGTGYPKTYTFQTTLTDVDGNVAIGGSQAQAMENLRRAINLDGVAGTNYATSMTAHPDVSAIDTATTVVATAKLPNSLTNGGNEITTTETSSVMSWGGSTLTGANNHSIAASGTYFYMARKGLLTNYYNGQMADMGVIYRALTQAEILEIWNGGAPADPTKYSFANDILNLGQTSLVNGGDAWDGGDYLVLKSSTDNNVWPSLFGKVEISDLNMEAANNYDFDGPFRGYLNLLSLTFNGSTTWVDFGDVHDYERTSPFSIECWFKTSASAAQDLVTKLDSAGGGGSGYGVWIDSSGSVHFEATNSNGGTDQLEVNTTATGFNDGSWHHCVVTYDGSSAPGGVHIWIDNSDEGLTTVSNTLSATILNAVALRIGARSDSSNVLTGNMCQVAIYSRVLTSGEVAELQSNGPINKAAAAAWPALVGWWQLGSGDTASSVVDRASSIVGGNNGTPAGSPALSSDVPTGGLNAFNVYCFLDSTDAQRIDCGNVSAFAFEYTDTFSLECWFRSSDTSGCYLLSKMDTSGYYVYLNTNGSIWFSRRNTATTNETLIETVQGFNDGNWHHLAVTSDGSNAAGCNIYVDGRLRDATTVADTLSATILNTAAFQVGDRNNLGANTLQGGVADVAAYNKELSAAEVLEHYNSAVNFTGERGSPGNRHGYSTAANLVAWYPFTACQGSASTFEVYDHSINSYNHGTFTGTADIGLGQLFDDGPEGSQSTWSGTASDVTQLGPDQDRSYTAPFMRNPTQLNDGLLGLDSMIRGAPDDQENAGDPLPPGGGTGITEYFLMRGVDNGTSAYTTWVVTGAPDPNGAQATAGNTTPTLVGSIVAGSGIVLTTWQQ